MGDGKGSLGGFAGMEVSESAVSPSQAEALAELCVEVARGFSKGEVESAAIRAGLAVARELTDRLRAGTTPGARPQSGWTAFMVRRPDGGASLVLEDTAEAQALELRLAPSGRFTGAAWRAPGDDPELLAFRVTAAGDGFALEVSDGRRVVVAELGRNRVLAFTREAGGDNVDPFAGALGGLLAEHGLTEVIPTRPAPPVLDEERPAPTAARAESSGWVLRVTSGPSPGASFQVADGAVLGRAKAAAIHLDVKSVSRRHAELHQRAAGWAISDLGSSNGTWVNGTRVRSATALKPSDQVQVGEVVMLVETGLAADDISEAPTARNLPLQKRSSS
jgi:hypothetical protein